MNARVSAPILVTRPEAPGRELAADLAGLGVRALWLPAFDLGAAPDPDAARAALAALGEFDLAVLVSPAAVRAAAGLLDAAWPSHVMIGAVGRATADAARTHLAAAACARIIAPAGDEEGGSEALLAALDAQSIAPRRVLILRAASGREWLAQRFAERHAEVRSIAVYDRRPHALTGNDLARLHALGSGPVDSVFSSSEAVATMRATLAAVAGLWPRLCAGTAVASHARISQRLAREGFARTIVVPLAADEIVQALSACP